MALAAIGTGDEAVRVRWLPARAGCCRAGGAAKTDDDDAAAVGGGGAGDDRPDGAGGTLSSGTRN